MAGGILGVGVDLVDIGRIAQLRERHGERMCGLIFHQAEMDYCLAKALPDESLAARFAAKEAVMKALGTGWADGVGFMGIEVEVSSSGQPGARLHGKTLETALRLGAGEIHLSLSHSKTMATAYALIEKGEKAGTSEKS